ncbi:MAG: class I SAM-dependent methyltransferase [Rhodothermales bacterium]
MYPNTQGKHHVYSLITLCCLFLILPACAQSDVSQETVDGERYKIKQASRDGIGKFYMGREISHVMGFAGASWLERPDRDTEEATSQLVAKLPLNASDVVADIGAGTGYFTFRMAQRVPQGKVLAVDIQQEMLDVMTRRIEQAGISNVDLIKGQADNPNLPANTVDLILLVDVYHEFAYPFEMKQGMLSALKPGGKIVLIEYRGEDRNVPIKPLHKMTQRQARAEMEAAGLTWVETLDFLPQQHFMIFEKP